MAASASSKFHQIPDALWQRIEPLLPSYKPSCKGGRPRLPMRQVVGGILYVLKTGCQWKAMPHEFGTYYTVVVYHAGRAADAFGPFSSTLYLCLR